MVGYRHRKGFWERSYDTSVRVNGKQPFPTIICMTAVEAIKSELITLLYN